MRTYLDCAAFVHDPHDTHGPFLADIWIVRVPIRADRMQGIKEGKRVFPLFSSVNIDAASFKTFTAMAARSCLAWNALALVAALNNCAFLPSPLNAYDLAMCDGEVALASLILRSFDDDPEIDWSRTQANGLYCDPSIPF